MKGQSAGLSLDFLYASGDQNYDDDELNGFKADKNFDMGMILFRHLMASTSARTPVLASDPDLLGYPSENLDRIPTRGGATNTRSFFPRAWWNPIKGVEIYGGVLMAMSDVKQTNPFYSRLAGGMSRNHLDGQPVLILAPNTMGIRVFMHRKLFKVRFAIEGAHFVPEMDSPMRPAESLPHHRYALHLRGATMKSRNMITRPLSLAALLTVLVGCHQDDAMESLSGAPEGIAVATPARTTVKLDFRARTLPEIPLPNDIATRYDPTSPTGRRVNASLIAPTTFEARVRKLVDELDGWGVGQPITIPFTGPLDVGSIVDGHRDVDYDPNDVVYVIDITPGSPSRHQIMDAGKATSVVLERGEYRRTIRYWTLSPS